MEPYNTALLAAKITIDVSEKGLLKGPYDEEHYHYIIKHITTESPAKSASNKFWPLFDFHCACYKEELESEPPERIYMEALIELLRIHHELEKCDDMKDEPVFNVNTQSLQTIQGNGVHAKFV